MGSSARITDIKAIADLRPAMVRFGENTQVALRSTGNDAAKVLGWLQRDRLPYWKREIRIRSEQVVRANTLLISQTTGDNPRPSVDARKAHDLAKRRVHEAEAKHERTRYWIRSLDKEIVRYRAAISPMSTLARAAMTTGISRLDSLLGALDLYLAAGTPNQEKVRQGIKVEENEQETEESDSGDGVES